MELRIVTTSYKPASALEALAAEAARKLGARYVPRRGASIAKLRRETGARAIVVATEEGLEWHAGADAPPFFFHPGMSLVRAKRLADGGRDAMLAASAFTPGDSVVDCTAGLCSDSIVFSFAGGLDTQVTAVESELALHYIVSEGLKRYETGWDMFDAAMRRIQLKHTSHTEYLRSLADRSVDIIYFDPMFQSPEQSSSGIQPLRQFANASLLSHEAVQEAKRAARKAVVLKERGNAAEWERFGFTIVSAPNASVAYGVIRL